VITHTLLPLSPRLCALPEHVVIGEARASKRPRKNHFLPGRWVEPEPVCALNFHLSDHTIDMFDPVKRSTDATSKPSPYLSGLKAEVSRRH
jgi:hypothetical protein